MKQRSRTGGGRRRRKKASAKSNGTAEVVTIAARRPNSPLLSKPTGRAVAASAAPRADRPGEGESEASSSRPQERSEPARRAARIVNVAPRTMDASALERQRMLERLVLCEGRGAVTRLADAFLAEGFEFPEEQRVALQLLEHFDESQARTAMQVLERLYESEDPIKKPVLEQRLRRLEDHGEEDGTREAAAALRRAIR